MDQSQEKFFANLAAGNGAEEPEVDIELAKAGSSYKTRSAPPPAPHKAESPKSESEGWLTLDVYQTPDDIVVESAIAGVRPEDLDINVTHDSISIKGSRHKDSEVKDEDYLYQECYWGRFSRSVILPQEVDPERASVAFKNGILTVRLPKMARQKSKKLTVNTD